MEDSRGKPGPLEKNKELKEGDFMLRRVLVGDNERVFIIRKGRFEDILAPGEYWVTGMGVELERHNISQLVLVSAWRDFLVKERWVLVSRYFSLLETGD